MTLRVGVLVLLYVLACPQLAAGFFRQKAAHSTAERAEGLKQFFKSLDTDADGQIEPEEARRFIGETIGGSEFDTENEISAGLRMTLENLDTADIGQNLSQEELAAKQKSLTAERVEDWIRYSVRLPQYAEVFRDNSISGEDFFSMVSDDGHILKSDLGITSALHRQQLVRAINKLLMGIGKAPGPPRDVVAAASKCGEIEVRFEPPLDEGIPDVHLYLVERREVGKRKWRTAPHVPTSPAHDTVWEDTRVDPGTRYEYRVVAWNGIGGSEPSAPSGEVRAPSHCARRRFLGVWKSLAAAGAAGAAGAVYLYWSVTAGESAQKKRSRDGEGKSPLPSALKHSGGGGTGGAGAGAGGSAAAETGDTGAAKPRPKVTLSEAPSRSASGAGDAGSIAGSAAAEATSRLRAPGGGAASAAPAAAAGSLAARASSDPEGQRLETTTPPRGRDFKRSSTIPDKDLGKRPAGAPISGAPAEDAGVGANSAPKLQGRGENTAGDSAGGASAAAGAGGGGSGSGSGHGKGAEGPLRYKRVKSMKECNVDGCKKKFGMFSSFGSNEIHYCSKCLRCDQEAERSCFKSWKREHEEMLALRQKTNKPIPTLVPFQALSRGMMLSIGESSGSGNGNGGSRAAR